MGLFYYLGSTLKQIDLLADWLSLELEGLFVLSCPIHQIKTSYDTITHAYILPNKNHHLATHKPHRINPKWLFLLWYCNTCLHSSKQKPSTAHPPYRIDLKWFLLGLWYWNTCAFFWTKTIACPPTHTIDLKWFSFGVTVLFFGILASENTDFF